MQHCGSGVPAGSSRKLLLSGQSCGLPCPCTPHVLRPGTLGRCEELGKCNSLPSDQAALQHSWASPCQIFVLRRLSPAPRWTQGLAASASTPDRVRSANEKHLQQR